jgi:hypothetical protein
VTFYGNHAKTGVGATLALFGGDGTLLNCTFAHNQCDAANHVRGGHLRLSPA